MPNLNKLFVIGYAGTNPELRNTPKGTPMATFRLAINEPLRPGHRRETLWFTVACFGQLAEIARDRIKKGACVLIEGKLAMRSWTGKKGEKRLDPHLYVEHFIVLGGEWRDTPDEDSTRELAAFL
jgi:single-strand DNA-binding protein